MQTSSEFIQKNIKKFFNDSSDVFVAPNIPEKKLNGAVKAFNVQNHNHIVAIYDSTLLGGADEGIVFTGEKMILKVNEKNIDVYYNNIQSLRCIVSMKAKSTTDKVIDTGLILGGGIPGIGAKFIKDKMTTNEEYKISLVTKDENEFIIEKIIKDKDMESLANFIQQLLKECNAESFKNEDMLKPIEEMSENFKIAYIQVITSITYNKNKQIDSKQLSEIFLLMTRLRLQKESRFTIREFILDSKNYESLDIQPLLLSMKEEYPIHYDSTIISLIKDVINMQSCVKEKVERDEDFIKQCKEMFGVERDKVEFTYEAVENDYKLLKEEVEDDTLKKTIKDLAARAASVGVPLGAVYMSGSVVGMSAAGITSGLATLGMGGLLGFSGMVTGIGVVILLGVGAYQGVKFLTSDNALSKYKQREMMLHGIIISTQKTISLVIEDVNFVVEKLNNVVSTMNEQDFTQKEVIKKLFGELQKYQKVLFAINNKQKQIQNMEGRLQCPKIISVERLKSITSESTKQQYYDFVMSYYEEQIIKDGEKEKKEFMLKANIALDDLEKIAQILEAIGYFKGTNVAKDKITSGIKGIFSNEKE